MEEQPLSPGLTQGFRQVESLPIKIKNTLRTGATNSMYFAAVHLGF
jgi:hypothetical protein